MLVKSSSQEGFVREWKRFGGGYSCCKVVLWKEAVCMDTKQGGMGIRSLSILNKALLGFGGSMKREGKGMGVGLWKTIKKDGKCFKLEPAL